MIVGLFGSEVVVNDQLAIAPLRAKALPHLSLAVAGISVNQYFVSGAKLAVRTPVQELSAFSVQLTVVTAPCGAKTVALPRVVMP